LIGATARAVAALSHVSGLPLGVEQDMEPSEEVLRGLLAAAPDALLVVDTTGRIVFVSDQAEKLFEWGRDDLVGQPVECLVPERFRSAHPALRDGYVRHPITRPMGAGLDLWGQRKDGSEFPAEISLSGFSTSEGEMVAAAIRDATATRRSEHRLRAVLASAPDAIIGVNASGRIELLNGQAERLFGWTSRELLGQQIEVLVPESGLSRHEGHRAKFVAEPSARPMGAGLHLSARRKDGSTFPAEISLSSVDERDSLLVLAAVRDVTERVEFERLRRREALEVQRERSHRLESLGQLAGGVAHDFNNLLGVILNYSTLLARQLTDAQSIADVGEITAAAERASALTRQLLAFARRDVAYPESTDVNEIISGFASLLERTLGDDIELRFELAPIPLIVLIDRHQLEQIVLNLSLNSRDAMRTGGTLTIRTSLEPARSGGGADGTNSPDRVRIDVIDTGAGMDDDVMSRAFEPFFTTKPLGEGTGLGLATVHGIVGQNGGMVTLESSPQAGTTVSVALDRVDTRASETKPSRRSANGGSERLLLVEDETALRVVTQRILVEHGYDVVTAVDGVDAIEIFDRLGGAIDALVTDVAMPRMRGDELAVHLSERLPGLPVVMMSGYSSGDVVGHERVLEKPVPQAELLRAIREALDA
jgi:PAS domain S-box-containing protein